MATPCRAHRCPNLVTGRAMQGYCDRHSDQRSNWTHRVDRSGSTTSRGYGYKWRKLREQVLIRDGYLCVMCAANNRHVQASDVDHIKRKADGGTDGLDNLQSLCKRCHRAKTAKE